MEGQDVLHTRPAESVDALAVVAHHADVTVRCCEFTEYDVLGEVRVLILVYQNVAEAAADLLKGIRKIAEKDMGVDEYVVEIHRSGNLAFLGVKTVNVAEAPPAGHLVLLDGRRCAGVDGGGDQTVLGRRNAVGDFSGLVDLVVQFQLLDALLHRGAAV